VLVPFLWFSKVQKRFKIILGCLRLASSVMGNSSRPSSVDEKVLLPCPNFWKHDQCQPVRLGPLASSMSFLGSGVKASSSWPDTEGRGFAE
jgi:hypothetical protein